METFHLEKRADGAYGVAEPGRRCRTGSVRLITAAALATAVAVGTVVSVSVMGGKHDQVDQVFAAAAADLRDLNAQLATLNEALRSEMERDLGDNADTIDLLAVPILDTVEDFEPPPLADVIEQIGDEGLARALLRLNARAGDAEAAALLGGGAG